LNVSRFLLEVRMENTEINAIANMLANNPLPVSKKLNEHLL
jgi:hypothetical protein